MSQVPTDAKALGARLRSAREARGLTQQQAADHLGVARTTVVAIEKGERRVRARELMELAGLYGRQVSELLQQGPPEEAFAVQLRGSLPSMPAVDADLLPQIEEFQKLSEDYARLEELCRAPLKRRYPALYEIAGADPEVASEDVAAGERRRLGLGEGPLLRLRDVLEQDVGLRVFQPELPSSVAGMFAFTEGLGGCIAVNRLHPHERRRHSQAHEYAHFLIDRRQPEVLYLDRYQRKPVEERFCEAFARAFLMPREGLRRRFLEIQQDRGGMPTYGDLCRLAHHYDVSLQAMTLRLEELRLLPAGVWERLKQEGSRVTEARRLFGLEGVDADQALLSTRYRALAVEAWQRGELSEGQLARYLRTDRVGARGVVSSFLSTQDPDSGLEAPDLTTPLLQLG